MGSRRARMPEVIQRALGLAAALVTLPLVAMLALLIRLLDGGPSLYRASRIGLHGRPLRLVKLRTMRPDADRVGPAITGDDDPRVTRLGRFLRRYRIDELPQFWQVVTGQMLLVGPRPEDPRFVDPDHPLQGAILQHKPGLTGISQLIHVREDEMLGQDDPERRYRDEILPEKLRLDARYLASKSARLDAWILAVTVGAAVGRPPSRAAVERRLVATYGAADGPV